MHSGSLDMFCISILPQLVAIKIIMHLIQAHTLFKKVLPHILQSNSTPPWEGITVLAAWGQAMKKEEIWIHVQAWLWLTQTKKNL